MNVYKVSKTGIIYDNEYSAFICAARNEEEARYTIPDTGVCFANKINELKLEDLDKWEIDLNTLDVKLLGEVNIPDSDPIVWLITKG